MFSFKRVSRLLLCVLIGGCVRVPSLETLNSIPIKDVVKRVKCEILDAVWEPLHLREYAWFHTWTVGVDLNLIVNEQAGLSPSVAFIDPLLPAVIPKIGSIAQNFTLGLGASATTTAVRTEIVSFALALEEINDEMINQGKLRTLYNDCLLPDRHDLDSNLGLKEWIRSALSPVAAGYLTRGFHIRPKAPGGKAGAALRKDERELRVMIYKFDNDREKLRRNPTEADVNRVKDDIEKILAKIKTMGLSTPEWKKYASQLTTLKGKLRTPDAPIESISHQVQFVVVLSGNASPNWTLARFKGPAAGSGSLASVTRTETHTLTIILGEPGAPTARDNRTILGITAGLNNTLRTLSPTP